ncbi:ATP-dependent RNA helicase RhlB [Aurantivibrio infirmus]
MLTRLFGKRPPSKDAQSVAAQKKNDSTADSSSTDSGKGESSTRRSQSKNTGANSSRSSGRNRNSNRSSNRGRSPNRNNSSQDKEDNSSNPNVKNKASQTRSTQSGKPQSQNANQNKKNHQSNSDKKAEHQAWDITQFPVEAVEGKTRFHDFGLPNELMHAIANLRFEYCSPIQARSLPHALNGEDIIGKAQTGTGKTAAFLVAIIDDLMKHPVEHQRYAGEARALIIAPTRELVLQIAEDAKALTEYTDLHVQALVGGMDYQKQQRGLQDNLVDILVATPGRLLDFCSNKDVHLDQIEVLVIDEADRMLDMGFIPQIRRVVRLTPQKSHRQTLLFSATFSDDVMNLVEQWTDNAVQIEIEPESIATDTVTQYVYLASTDEKFTLLFNILKQEDVESLIVFSNRRDECRDLHERLVAHGFTAGLLSGEIAQNQRVRTLDGFKTRKLKVLVATDVAGRGIHIDGISHVVNFTLPEEPEDYVHRIGRTGRAGKLGTSISFACEDDAFRLMPIQELIGEDLKCTQPPESLLAAPPEVEMPKRRRSSGNRNSGGRSGGRSGGNSSNRNRR